MASLMGSTADESLRKTLSLVAVMGAKAEVSLAAAKSATVCAESVKVMLSCARAAGVAIQSSPASAPYMALLLKAFIRSFIVLC